MITISRNRHCKNPGNGPLLCLLCRYCYWKIELNEWKYEEFIARNFSYQALVEKQWTNCVFPHSCLNKQRNDSRFVKHKCDTWSMLFHFDKELYFLHLVRLSSSESISLAFFHFIFKWRTHLQVEYFIIRLFSVDKLWKLVGHWRYFWADIWRSFQALVEVGQVFHERWESANFHPI